MQISFLFILDRFPVHLVDHSLSQMILWKTLGSFETQRKNRLQPMKGTEKGSRIKRSVAICIFAKILFYFYSIPIFISYMFHIIFLYTVWYIHAIYRKQLMSWYKYKIIECLELPGWFQYILFDFKQYTRK